MISSVIVIFSNDISNDITNVITILYRKKFQALCYAPYAHVLRTRTWDVLRKLWGSQKALKNMSESGELLWKASEPKTKVSLQTSFNNWQKRRPSSLHLVKHFWSEKLGFATDIL